MDKLEREMKRWSKTRRMGRTKFVWLCGVVLWGIASAFIWSTVMSMISTWDWWSSYLFNALIGFPIAGFVFASAVWNAMERKHNNYLQPTHDSPIDGDEGPSVISDNPYAPPTSEHLLVRSLPKRES